MIQEDDDIVRGIGFVAIYSAFLEGKVNELLSVLSSIEEFTDKIKREPISSRIKRAKRILQTIDHPLCEALRDTLDDCSTNFDWRNEIVHGLVLSPDYHEENLRSLRPNVADRKVDPKEVYVLANNLLALRSNRVITESGV